MFEVEQLGETHIMWMRRPFSTQLRVEEDTSRRSDTDDASAAAGVGSNGQHPDQDQHTGAGADGAGGPLRMSFALIKSVSALMDAVVNCHHLPRS